MTSALVEVYFDYLLPPDTILFAIEDDVAKAGLPPKDAQYSFDARSNMVGHLLNVSKIAFNPNGELFAVRGEELYRGPMPANRNFDWFCIVKRVGRTGWDAFKFLLFDPQGVLYAATYNGELYKGPAPSNDDVSWIRQEAILVGSSSWSRFSALFFDLKGNLYAVAADTLVMRSPPAGPETRWFYSSTPVGIRGWRFLSRFMAVGPDEALWCVDSRTGFIYKGPLPTKEDQRYLERAEKVGWGFNCYKHLSFTFDKIVKSILSCEFLPESGKILSRATEVVQTQTYCNRGNSPVKHMFALSKPLIQTSTFSQEHGYTSGVGAEVKFTASVPCISDAESQIFFVDPSTTRTWSFTKDNQIQVTFSSSCVELPPEHAVHVTASVTKAEIAIPYRMVIRTLFDYETTISGTWKSIQHYNMTITPEYYERIQPFAPVQYEV